MLMVMAMVMVLVMAMAMVMVMVIVICVNAPSTIVCPTNKWFKYNCLSKIPGGFNRIKYLSAVS